MALTANQKIGTCELCGKTNTVVEASGYYVAFACLPCLRGWHRDDEED